ncbi:MAG: phenylalanine--tRNA ligase subunit beta [Deltaproteobacteria bacterium]
MKIPLSWLTEFVSTRLSPSQIQEALTMAGVEVSSCRFLGEGMDRVVTARITECRPHPNADRLSLCRVTDGSREYDIVCGAKNMREQDIVALALPGAKLPNGMEIRKTKIRGQSSEGMLCSEQELGLAEESAGILILPYDTPIGSPLAPAIGMDDWLLEVEITPNRGDCLSVLGVAREIAAIAGEPVRIPQAPVRESGPPIAELASVGVTDLDLCPRYTARVITDVTIAPSPALIRRRLELCGVRPINNIVDITNYLMLEAGQPMHAFDLDRLDGRRIDVRRAGTVRRFTTLDGVEREIRPEMLLIWDGSGPVAVAGVMGGENTEVLPETRRVLFESAHFVPSTIRATSRRLGLSSESSYRFERGVDPGGTRYAADRAVSLLAESFSFTAAAGIFDVGGEGSFARKVPFRPLRAARIVGAEYTASGCAAIFRRLGFEVDGEGEETLRVTVPSHRFDIEREIDLVEEVARLSGYDAIPTTYPESKAPEFSPDDRFASKIERISEFLCAQGFCQAINLSFVSGREWERHAARLGFDPDDAMRLANPLSEETTLMRPHLLTGLLGNVSGNLRRFLEEIRLFEVGKAYGKSLSAGHFEEDRLGMILYGRREPWSWSGRGSSLDFYDLKGLVESVLAQLGKGPVHFLPAKERPFFDPRKSAEALRDGDIIGWFGAVHRELLDAAEIPGTAWYAEIRLRAAILDAPAVIYRPIPKFPPVSRDFACIFPRTVPVGDVLSMVRELSPEIADASVFDVYTGEQIGEGKKSVAFRVRIQPADRTLTDAEVHSIHTKIVKLLENRFGGSIRAS